jgi:DNA-nicking Smr family endonuclease
VSPDDDIPSLEIEDSIDLHGFVPRDVPSVVESYLEAAWAKGVTEVRLIHGRGKGVQRARVQQLLRSSPYVAHFTDASPMRGGWGATLVWLRSKPTAER